MSLRCRWTAAEGEAREDEETSFRLSYCGAAPGERPQLLLRRGGILQPFILSPDSHYDPH
jgi:hypothetical protein